MTDNPAISPLVADIISANVANLANVTNQLLDGLTLERDELEVTLRLIRWNINDLFSGPYAPSETAIRDALHPDRSYIDALVEEKQRGEAS